MLNFSSCNFTCASLKQPVKLASRRFSSQKIDRKDNPQKSILLEREETIQLFASLMQMFQLLFLTQTTLCAVPNQKKLLVKTASVFAD